MRLSSARCAVVKMVVAAHGVLNQLAPLSRCITKLLARRTLVEYPNLVAASLGPFDVILGIQVVHRSTRVFRQSSQKCRHFWCVIRLLRTLNAGSPADRRELGLFLKIDSTVTNFDLASTQNAENPKTCLPIFQTILM
jgi:hypothetical protein